MPRGVTSKAHARPQASGKPREASTITSLFAQSGSPIGSNVASATWIRSHAITTYTIATRTTLRRRNSANQRARVAFGSFIGGPGIRLNYKWRCAPAGAHRARLVALSVRGGDGVG